MLKHIHYIRPVGTESCVLDKMGLDKMGLDEVVLNLSKIALDHVLCTYTYVMDYVCFHHFLILLDVIFKTNEWKVHTITVNTHSNQWTVLFLLWKLGMTNQNFWVIITKLNIIITWQDKYPRRVCNMFKNVGVILKIAPWF